MIVLDSLSGNSYISVSLGSFGRFTSFLWYHRISQIVHVPCSFALVEHLKQQPPLHVRVAWLQQGKPLPVSPGGDSGASHVFPLDVHTSPHCRGRSFEVVHLPPPCRTMATSRFLSFFSRAGHRHVGPRVPVPFLSLLLKEEDCIRCASLFSTELCQLLRAACPFPRETLTCQHIATSSTSVLPPRGGVSGRCSWFAFWNSPGL